MDYLIQAAELGNHGLEIALLFGLPRAPGFNLNSEEYAAKETDNIRRADKAETDYAVVIKGPTYASVICP